VIPEAGADIGVGTLDPRSPSEATRQLVDSEARAVIEQCHARALELLRANRDRLDHLAAALLEHETLDEHDAASAADLGALVGR
jgi:cell division protease FtsH